MPKLRELAWIAAGLGILWGCTEKKPVQPPETSRQTPRPPSDPYELSLHDKGYTALVRRSRPPDSLLGPLVAEVVSIRDVSGPLNEQIGAVRLDEMEFGGRVRAITSVYDAIRNDRNIVILRTTDLTFYFSDVSDLSEGKGSRFFLVTENLSTGEQAKFLIR